MITFIEMWVSIKAWWDELLETLRDRPEDVLWDLIRVVLM